MIIGVGIDIIEVERMRESLERHGDRFLEHVFTPAEIANAPAGLGRPAYFAARWAAKEAASKALGTGIGAGCGWHDIEVQKRPSGQPYLTVTGAGAATAATLAVRSFHVSYSHERGNACAVVIAEG
jgi:holo-[acyl-carrier protein] synthase